MGRQELIEKILSDAEDEARAAIAAAEETAAKLLSSAREKADKAMEETRGETQAKAKALAEVSAASARLEGAKILLSEKRGVIDSVYALAAKKLAAMDDKTYLSFIETLLSAYAEEGDEIMFADDFSYWSEVTQLKTIKEKKLKVSFSGAKIDGGFLLNGEKADKDLSFKSLLEADRAEHEAEIAAALFARTGG